MSNDKDILDREIPGFTGRLILYIVGSAGSAIIFIMATYFSTTDQIKDSEHRIMAEIKGNRSEQILTDTIQNRDIADVKSTLAKLMVK